MADGSVTIDHTRRGHSPLGASGAERWMKCPGSVALLKELDLPESDEEDYRREGTAMHEAAEHCLREGLDTWEIVGQSWNNTVIDAPMADAIQVYLDTVRPDMDRAFKSFVEYKVSSPVHPKFYGTADFVALVHGSEAGQMLDVTDLKGGEGIIVEPDDNPQLKYYAFGVLEQMVRDGHAILPNEFRVRLRIVQPRAYHPTGEVVRSWWTTAGEIAEWVHDTLVPAMAATEYDNSLDAGPWCRFCPAKLVCPLLNSLFKAACVADPKAVGDHTDAGLGRSYQYVQAVKFYLKALEGEVYKRLNRGVTMDGVVKLVNKKADRVWKPTAAELLKEKFGAEAMTTPELKSPAAIEKLGPAAKELVKGQAYMPVTGTTVALWDDPRAGVKVTTNQEAFAGALAKLNEDKTDD